MNDHYPATREPVIIVGAGPAGCTAALLLADSGIPVTLLERHTQPHPLPRAVHLDDEVARTLDRIGVSEGFLARSRPGSGLRLLDAGHRVMAEFHREHQASEHGFPQANMFHQPDLEELMLARVKAHPLIDFRRGAEVIGLDDDDAPGPLTASPGPGARPHRRGPADVHRPGRAGLRRRQQHDPGTGRDHHGRPGLHRTLARGRHPRRGPAWTPGTAWSRSATRPGPPRSCRSPATGTAGSSGCSTARTKPA